MSLLNNDLRMKVLSNLQNPVDAAPLFEDEQDIIDSLKSIVSDVPVKGMLLDMLQRAEAYSRVIGSEAHSFFTHLRKVGTVVYISFGYNTYFIALDNEDYDGDHWKKLLGHGVVRSYYKEGWKSNGCSFKLAVQDEPKFMRDMQVIAKYYDIETRENARGMDMDRIKPYFM
jgi:hypothetical protein